MRCMICKVCCKGGCCRIETVYVGQRTWGVADMSGLCLVMCSLGGNRQTRWLCVLIKTVLKGNVYSVVLGLQPCCKG